MNFDYSCIYTNRPKMVNDNKTFNKYVNSKFLLYDGRDNHKELLDSIHEVVASEEMKEKKT